MRNLTIIFCTRSILILFSILSSFHTSAQIEDPTNYIRTDLVSTSPTVANISKVGDIPITMYTGTANVTVPLHEYKGSELSIPINLSYGYSGFQPRSEASWVGLGWNLTCQGVITRTIRDKVDGTMAPGHNYADIADQILTLASEQNGDFLKNVADPDFITNMYDAEPDIYSFNFSGHSGKFIIVNGVFYTYPYNKYRISGNPESGFSITDDLGVVYIFGEAETTHQLAPHDNVPYQMPDFKSSYHLTSIRHPNGETATYEYQNEGDLVQLGVLTQSYYKVQDRSTIYGNSAPSSTMYNQKRSYLTSVQNVKRLTRIVTDREIIEFNATNKRNDVNGNLFALGSIVVQNHLGVEVKRYRLSHNYFKKLNSSSHLEAYLKLTSVAKLENGTINGTKEEYTFEYENETSSFPNADEATVDHFGYFKAFGSSNVIVPSEFDGYEVAGASGSNRTPAFDYAKYGALKRVNYPTGGYTEFTYELNKRRRDTPVFTSLDWLDNSETQLQRPSNTSNELLYGQYEFFSLTHDQEINIFLERALINSGISANDLADIEIYEYQPSTHTIGDLVVSWKTRAFVTSQSELVSLSSGFYAYRLILDDDESFMNVAIAFRKHLADEGNPGPGIRIKKIESVPISGTPVIKTYTYQDALGFSTGSSVGFQQYRETYMYYEVGNSHSVDGTRCPVLMSCNDYSSGRIFSSSLSPSHNPGFEIFYSQVDEYIESAEGNSRTSFYFIKHQSVGTYNFLGADILQRIDFSLKNGNYEVVNREINTYNVNSHGGHFNAITPYLNYSFSGQGHPTDGGERSRYGFNHYSLSSMSTQLSQTRHLQYDEKGNLQETVKNYLYHPVTKNILEEENVNSDGSSLIKRYKFPEDYIPQIASHLVNANMLKKPIEIQNWIKLPNGTRIVTGGIITEYLAGLYVLPIRYHFLEPTANVNGLDSEFISNGLYSTLVSDSKYLPRINLTYSQNRVLNQHFRGVDNSYMWGYDNRYIIASSMGAPPSSIYYTSFEDSNGTEQSAARTGEKVRTSNFSLSINGLENGEYVLSYWSLNSGAWAYQQENIVISNASSSNPPNGSYQRTISASASSPIDDLRLHPKGAQMTSYTYDPGIGMTSQTDANGRTTYYEYDGFGRLYRVKDDTGKILNEYTYHYKGQ